ncbi:MAG: hypothetical protein MUF58_02595 [Arcicella sp.]|jgi:DNA polymerase III alpha subunit|nr:hypothetical protein [Arcicella sp.]
MAKYKPKKIIIVCWVGICLTLLTSIKAFAQDIDTITTKQVNQYLNKEVVLKGTIVHIKAHQTEQGDNMVFIDLDDKYPHNLISITIYENVLNQLKPAIYGFLNKTVAIKGIIKSYRKAPSLKLKKPEHLSVL